MIQLSNLYKSYKDREYPILKNAFLNLPNTGLFFLQGRNGSGKSTLLNILSGADQDYEGKISIGDQSLDKKHYSTFAEKNVIYLTQDPIVFDDESVLDNLLITYGRRYKSAAVEAIHRCGLDAQIQQRAGTLSHGERQRLAIARALVKKPAIILADEVTSNLDRPNALNILQLLTELSKNSLVVFATHEANILTGFSPRGVISIEAGQVFLETKTAVESENESKTNIAGNSILNAVSWALLRNRFTWIMTAVICLISLASAIGFQQIGNAYPSRGETIYQSALLNGPAVAFSASFDEANRLPTGSFFQDTGDSRASFSEKISDVLEPGSSVSATLGLSLESEDEETISDAFKQAGIQLQYGHYPKSEDEIVVSSLCWKWIVASRRWDNQQMLTLLEEGETLQVPQLGDEISGIYIPFSSISEEDYAKRLAQISKTDTGSLACFSLGLNTAFTISSGNGSRWIAKVDDSTRSLLAEYCPAMLSGMVIATSGSGVGSDVYAPFSGGVDWFDILNENAYEWAGYAVAVFPLLWAFGLQAILAIHDQKGYCMSRVIGITRRTQIVGTVLCSLISFLLGFVLGAGLGFAISAIFHSAISNSFSGLLLPSFASPDWIVGLFSGISTALAVVATGLLVSFVMSPKNLTRKLDQLKDR